MGLPLTLLILLSAAPPDGQPRRDWSGSPALVDLRGVDRLFAVGDLHGDYERAVALLVAAGVLAESPAKPGAVRWNAGRAVLVCTGDLIDKYERSLDVVRLMRALERAAAAAGGRVVVVLGNHEAEFLAAGGRDKKGHEFAAELERAGLAPEAVAAGSDAEGIGAWLRLRPIGARVDGWFFSHAGNSHGLTFDALAADVVRQVDAGGFGAPVLSSDDSILEARLHPRPWWEPGEAGHGKKARAVQAEAGRAEVERSAAALGVRHLAFGHQPGKVKFAPGQEREAGTPYLGFNGLVLLLDTGMSRGVDGARGAVVEVLHPGRADEQVKALFADGSSAALSP